MRDGANMLIRHIASGDLVYMLVDSDCDGFCSTALFLNYFHNLFPTAIENNFIYETHDGKYHGIELERVPADTKLVIALDASSNEIETHKALAEKGIDVLVLDHHQAPERSPYACVINNQLCDYPTKSLCGAGIVYKFCSFIDSIMNTSYANEYLDLVAVALSADMMDLRDYETRHLVTLGCNRVVNPFIKQMMVLNDYSIKGELNPHTIGFYIAPYVNAAARVGNLAETKLLIDSMLEWLAYEEIPSTKRGYSGTTETRVEQACRTCSNIRNRQNRLRDASLDFIRNEIKEKELDKDKIIIVQAPKTQQLNTNLTGLMGNQISAEYQHPVLILNEREHEDEKWWEGSARGLERSAIADFRSFLLGTGLTEYCEGHGNAFGAGIKDSKIKTLREYTNRLLSNIDFSPIYNVDFIYNANLLKGQTILNIANYNYLWGQMVKEPFIVVEKLNVSADNASVMKGPAVKIVQNGIEFVKFKMSEEEVEALIPSEGVNEITIVGTCTINTWGGRTTPQVFIEDYEITKHLLYYF